MRQRIDPERITKYLDMYNSGLSIYKIAAMENCTPEWVRRILGRSGGYVARPRKHAVKVNKAKRKQTAGGENVPQTADSL